jgi:hypothetical protein
MGIVRLEGLGQLKKSNNITVNQTRDHPACSIVLPRLLYWSTIYFAAGSLEDATFCRPICSWSAPNCMPLFDVTSSAGLPLSL